VRSRAQLMLGLWALAPVVLLLFIFLTWPHIDGGSGSFNSYDPAYSNSVPLTKWRALELLGTLALTVVSVGVLLGDLWRRPLPRGLRKVWTVLMLFGAPFACLAYWLLHCHGPVPAANATDTP
jgi:hypothetical protein